MTNHEVLHILFNRGNAGNGESTFLEGVREELPEGWKRFSPEEKEVHPGAGLLKYHVWFGRQVRWRALSALREGREPLSRVEPRINSSLGRDLFAILYL